MSDPTESNTFDAADRADELLATIRHAVAPGASSEARTSGASACRAILHGLEPSLRNGASPSSPAAALAGTPLGAALGALSSIPREQVLEFLVSGVRALLGQGAPTYRPAPLRRAPDTTERSG